MKNYKGYFTENNPCNLPVAFNLDDRLEKLVYNSVYDKITNIFNNKIESVNDFEKINVKPAQKNPSEIDL